MLASNCAVSRRIEAAQCIPARSLGVIHYHSRNEKRHRNDAAFRALIVPFRILRCRKQGPLEMPALHSFNSDSSSAPVFRQVSSRYLSSNCHRGAICHRRHCRYLSSNCHRRASRHLNSNCHRRHIFCFFLSPGLQTMALPIA